LTGGEPSWLQGLVAAAGFALGLVCCAALAVIEWAAWVMILPGRRPGSLAAELDFEADPSSPSRRLGDPIEAVAADGVRLAGIWHAADPPEAEAAAGGDPPGKLPARPRGTVLVLHGFAEDPSALADRMAALNRHGWNVAALDTRAHGRSGGEFGSFGGREAADVRTWIDALAANGRVGNKNEHGAEDGPAPVVAVWGRSMGAAIAARAAANDPRIGAVVLEAPYVDLEETLTRVLKRKRIPLPGLLAGLVLKRAGAIAGVSLVRPRPIDLVPTIHAPALVLHGTDDTLIPLEDARLLAGSFPRPARLIEVPGAGHSTVVEVGGPGLLDRVATFLDEAADTQVSLSNQDND
jgi:alpha-beta hydrolase superfamily lysophospholipase